MLIGSPNSRGVIRLQGFLTRNGFPNHLLDPAVDPIPAGEYPKLRACLTYPLRLNCNYGENAESRWGRCEYMKYDDSKSIFDPRRWYCAAPE